MTSKRGNGGDRTPPVSTNKYFLTKLQELFNELLGGEARITSYSFEVTGAEGLYHLRWEQPVVEQPVVEHTETRHETH